MKEKTSYLFPLMLDRLGAPSNPEGEGRKNTVCVMDENNRHNGRKKLAALKGTKYYGVSEKENIIPTGKGK